MSLNTLPSNGQGFRGLSENFKGHFLRIKIRLKELEHNFEFVSVLAKKASKY